MYSNKENVNLLTDLLVKQGICHAVVCPGSRNSPIVHNLYECPEITCYPVTDERSAGFYALGMCQYLDGPVAVCVTSGTALLNLLPAVAEAFYQHCQLVVISADRPVEWIGQREGQTLPQDHALAPFVLKSVSLPEPSNLDEHWYANRLVNEALLALKHDGGGPVHINVPISEPLFDYSVAQLPAERVIQAFSPSVDEVGRNFVIQRFLEVSRPMVVIGQENGWHFKGLERILEQIASHAVLLYERLGLPNDRIQHFDEVLANEQGKDYEPDFLVVLGGTLVSKRLKIFLRRAPDLEVWSVGPDAEVCDTFMALKGMVQSDPIDFLKQLALALEHRQEVQPYHQVWQQALQTAERHAEDYVPEYSEMAAVRYFEEQLEDMEYGFQVHYGNSSAVRLANIYATHGVWCNRGVNGIDGSLSTAAGMSVVSHDRVFCVIGDLSFFYDGNALWNQNLKGNLRVILLNNGGGGIFCQFDGLKASPARDACIRGVHHVSAQGLCIQNDIGYLKARNLPEMQLGIVQLLTMTSERPVVLEIFTDAETDIKVVQDYLRNLDLQKSVN